MKSYPIMSIDEYKKTRHAEPYVLKYQNNKQKMVFFGAKHSTDITDSQFDQLSKEWKAFLNEQEISKKDYIVIVEGNKRAIQKTKEDAIKISGEAGLITFLANKENVVTECAEPSVTNTINILSKDYSHEELLYFYFVSKLKHLYRRKENISYTDLTGILGRLEEQLLFDDVEYSMNAIAKIHKKHFNFYFNHNHRGFISDLSVPYIEYGAFTNRIANDRDIYRNNFLLDYIESLWRDSRSIFIVFGSSHAVMMEKALKTITEN